MPVNQRVGVDQCENERKLALKRARGLRYSRSQKNKDRLARFYKTHEGKKAKQRANMLARYGISLAQYDTIFALQDGKCVGCGRPPKKRRLAVEHDHKTGRVRGLACHNCNRHLIGKNTAETARWLVAYLSSDFDGRKL